ncbi:MAG: purine-nucleoside phosphorylase [Pelovirga sp.]
MRYLDDVTAAADLLHGLLGVNQPEIAIVLGSGLDSGMDPADVVFSLQLADLPGFPDTGVCGHAGRLSAGTLYGRAVLIFHGRYHLYEGYDAWQVTAPVRLAAAVGCRRVLLTNAAGGIAAAMSAGDFMLVRDHLNLTGHNPLRGRSERAFVDLTHAYSAHYYERLAGCLKPKGVRLHCGVLAWMPGPSYETPAEINFLGCAGADAVSMSTVPEAIVARRYGMEVSALALIANPAAGRSPHPLSHAEVLAAGQASAENFRTLLEELLFHWNE